ncbi:MAG: hypothetical protein WDZ41_05410 [Candidatus Babeliales bacterium]
MNNSVKSILLGMLLISFAGANVQAGITDWFKKPVKSVTNATQSVWNTEVSKTARRFVSSNTYMAAQIFSIFGWMNLGLYALWYPEFKQVCGLSDKTMIQSIGKTFAFALAAYCLSKTLEVDKKKSVETKTETESQPEIGNETEENK